MKRDKKVLYESQNDEWTTPAWLFQDLNREFQFNLDPCATDENALTPLYFTKAENGLLQDWGGCRVFCNPPYSRIKEWVEKCHDEGVKDNAVVVMLVPARTDTRWFHDFIYNRAEVRFIKGRVRFSDSKYNAPFPSMVVVFRGATR